MADQPTDPPDDLQGVLADLDAILAGSAPAEAVPPAAAAKPPEPFEPAKPAAPPKPAETPAPPTAPAPAPAAPLPVGDDSEAVPATAPKEQVRRVAYAYTLACRDARERFELFLGQSARTISKKPLYLRPVLTVEVGPASDAAAIAEKARQARAVAVLAVVEGWPAAKVDALSDACSRGGLMFRSVASTDVQRKSTAVDVLVDMMLLPGEA